MHRRTFLRSSAAGSLLASLPAGFARAALEPVGTFRVFEVTTEVEILKPAGVTRVWIPAPLLDTAYQKSLGTTYEAQTGRVTLEREPKYGAGIVYGEFSEGLPARLSARSRFATRNWSVDVTQRTGATLTPAEAQLYTAATELIPTDGIVLDTARKITGNSTDDLQKARAIYEWIVDNTFRDAKTRGCGVGDIKFMLESGNLGGKCADLNALFVGLARASGIPARDVYGVRVADSARGYKSLGRTVGDITNAQHCRAEFFLNGVGWVPVDPADVRKVVLEEDGGRKLDDPKVVAARAFLFGNWEMNWLAFNTAHDLRLPGATRGSVGFLMYPQGETAEGRLDCLDPANFRYRMTSRELAS